MSKIILPFIPALHKYEFCLCTGVNEITLRKMIAESEDQLKKVGYNKWQKLLMPLQVKFLINKYGLTIDYDMFTQICAGLKR